MVSRPLRAIMKTAVLAVLAVLVAASFTMAPVARAQECGVSPMLYERPLLVADADAAPVRQALDRGELAEVARLARERLDVKTLERELRRGMWRPTAFGEADVRAALAIAIVRSGGLEGPRAQTRKRAQMKRNVAWARDLLARAFDATSGDPVLATWLGEAEAAVGEREKARALLEDLAQADLIVSPEGWAALAALRDDVDEAAAAQARSRCEAMARDAAMCAAPARDARS